MNKFISKFSAVTVKHFPKIVTFKWNAGILNFFFGGGGVQGYQFTLG